MSLPSHRTFHFLGRALAATLLTAGVGIASACDRSPSEPEVGGMVIREVILMGDDGSYAFSHIDHWHGAPVVRQGGNAGYRIYFSGVRLPPDDHDAPPTESWFTLENHPDHSVRVVIEDTTLARWTGDRVRGTLHGVREGASRMNLVVLKGTTTLYEAPPLNFRVQPPLP